MFTVISKNDSHLTGILPTSDVEHRSTGGENISSSVEKVCNSASALNTVTHQLSQVNERLFNVYRELTGVSGLILTADFQQENFIRDATLAQRGVCVPLTAKWLTERDVSPEIDFFADINSYWGREEVMHLAMESVRRGNGSVIFEYLNDKNFGMYPVAEGSPKSAGLYSISVKIDGLNFHNIALHISKEGSVYMFDPNYGEFKFHSSDEYYKFLPPYLRVAYSDNIDSTDLSYVQYSRKQS
ncbi:YopT-type cysteine protease domain-containing protein [Erwinia mallotivora]|uniref:YopT-type cysteine protease domain-containing protein n=1 Tax=Erwinia mallotivora TaxID=69222 RepID=UPI0021C096FF|nr:YopT-type cysteine protease domain-containing protein [Erwinia mallotivora]